MYINGIQSKEGVVKPVLTTVGPRDVKAALLQCSHTCQLMMHVCLAPLER